jgi:hypothetical protein
MGNLDNCTYVPYALVQDPVSTAAHAALENFLAITVGFQPRTGTAIDATECCALACVTVAADGAGNGTHGRSEPGSLGGTLGDRHVLGIGFALGPVLGHCIGVDALGVNNGVRMRGTASEIGRERE